CPSLTSSHLKAGQVDRVKIIASRMAGKNGLRIVTHPARIQPMTSAMARIRNKVILLIVSRLMMVSLKRMGYSSGLSFAPIFAWKSLCENRFMGYRFPMTEDRLQASETLVAHHERQ